VRPSGWYMCVIIGHEFLGKVIAMSLNNSFTLIPSLIIYILHNSLCSDQLLPLLLILINQLIINQLINYNILIFFNII
jgi:hypothetical protein